MSIFLVIVAALPAVASSSLIIFGDRMEAGFIHWLGVSDISTPVEIGWRIGRYALAFATTTFVTALLYYFGPNHRPEPQYMQRAMASRFVRVWPGALVATTLWLLATAGFALYVRHFANYNIFYGAIRTVVVLLVWLYLIACISLLGCEFNAERERVAAVAIPD
jgi:membrane protein